MKAVLREIIHSSKDIIAMAEGLIELSDKVDEDVLLNEKFIKLSGGQIIAMVKEIMKMRRSITYFIIFRWPPKPNSSFILYTLIICVYASSSINEPNRHTALEKPLKFAAGYPTTMAMEATLHHFSQEDLSDIRIQVDYPDQTRFFFRPRLCEFLKQGEDAHHLSTKVLLHASTPWIDAALVKFTVVLMTGPGRSIPVAALESPSVRRTACVIAKILPA